MENFYIFLGMVVVSLVSGNPTVEVSSCPGGNVLLSCSCKMRDLSEPFRWQMANNKEPVSVLREGEENLTEDFKGRVESFYKENPSNCSILLKNVTYIHHGIYTCYYRSGTFIYTSVNLHVYGATNDTQPTNCSSPDYIISPTANKEMHWLISIPIMLGLLLLFLFLYRKVQGRANERQRAQIHRSVV